MPGEQSNPGRCGGTPQHGAPLDWPRAHADTGNGTGDTGGLGRGTPTPAAPTSGVAHGSLQAPPTPQQDPRAEEKGSDWAEPTRAPHQQHHSPPGQDIQPG